MGEGRLQYQVMPGIFLQHCERARANPDKRFVLIIDEINRGNLSRIFGELLMLLEYRDKKVRLPYAAGDGAAEQSHLQIPPNLYLIGTMNSTDRSLAMIDYALRRRFFFYRLLPVVDGQASVLERWLAGQDFTGFPAEAGAEATSSESTRRSESNSRPISRSATRTSWSPDIADHRA